MRSAAILLGVCACFLSAPRARASSIANGGFESGTFAGWTVNPASAGSFVFVGGHSHSGSDAAWFGAVGGADDTLLQTFATTLGASYDVSFWLGHGASDNRNGFSVWWDVTPLVLLNDAPRFNMTHYTFTILASGDSTTLRFSGHALQDYYYLDDVSVTPIPNPESSTLVLLLGGAVASWRLRRR